MKNILISVILIVFVATIFPTVNKYIKSAEKNTAITECKFVVNSAQALYAESYATGEEVTTEKIKEYCGINDEILNVDVNNGEIEHLTYLKPPCKVIYCRNYDNCSEHSEMYTAINTKTGKYY